MGEHDWFAEQFEGHRAHLRAVAYRMVGSMSDAEDAVQEAWLRLSRSGTSEIGNLGGWLTTVVARVCLDMLRARESRREEPLDADVSVMVPSDDKRTDPEQSALLADSLGSALLVVLDTLAPAERVAFVLHDMFGVPFDEIAPVVGRSTTAARQLASRSRRRVRGADNHGEVDLARQREVVDAFLAASRHGDFDALLAVLDPDVVLHADSTAMQMGTTGEVRGAESIANMFAGRARAARPALVDGAVGLAWAQRGRPRVVFDFTIIRGRIVHVDMVADPEQLGQLDLVILGA